MPRWGDWLGERKYLSSSAVSFRPNKTWNTLLNSSETNDIWGALKAPWKWEWVMSLVLSPKEMKS
jgi:hypothetical protein